MSILNFKKRQYTKPGIIEDKIKEILAKNSQGMTIQEICDVIIAEGLSVKYGAVSTNIENLVNDNLVVRLSRPKIKRGIKYGLVK